MLTLPAVTTIPQDTLELRQVFAQVCARSCPKYCNFHLHTVYSDGKMQPISLVDQAVSMRVRHFAITDHHSIEGYLIAKDYLQGLQSQGLDGAPRLWVGIEINASLLFNEVHILAYGFDPEHPAMLPYVQGRPAAGLEYQATHVIQAIHMAGGLAILAHPARYRRPPEDLIPLAASIGIDGVEAYYGYDNSDPWMPSPRQTQAICNLAQQYTLLSTCGTDSHGYKITRRL